MWTTRGGCQMGRRRGSCAPALYDHIQCDVCTQHTYSKRISFFSQQNDFGFSVYLSIFIPCRLRTIIAENERTHSCNQKVKKENSQKPNEQLFVDKIYGCSLCEQNLEHLKVRYQLNDSYLLDSRLNLTL